MEILRVARCQASVETCLTIWREIMHQLLGRVVDSEALERHGRCLLVALRVVLNNVKDMVFALTL